MKKLPITAFKKGESGNNKGRPRGALSKTTIFKEVIREGFEEQLKRDFHKVLKVVIEKALEGDMVAAKMLLDRAVPVTKAVEFDAPGSGKFSINIQIGSLEGATALSEDIEDAEYEEISNG